MNKLKILLMILCSIFSNNSCSNDNSPFNSVQNFFANISAFNYPKMKSDVTTDFQFLMAGKVLGMDSLINELKSEGVNYQRRNYFSFINSVTQNDVAWVSYWNKALFAKENESSESFWLDSAVLIKENDIWRIQLLHTTKLIKKRMPKDIEFIEYIK